MVGDRKERASPLLCPLQGLKLGMWGPPRARLEPAPRVEPGNAGEVQSPQIINFSCICCVF